MAAAHDVGLSGGRSSRSDVVKQLAAGSPADIVFGAAHQRAELTFVGKADERISVRWHWRGPDRVSTTARILAPDGTVLDEWNATSAGESDALTLPADGTYTVESSVDGDGTGAGTFELTDH